MQKSAVTNNIWSDFTKQLLNMTPKNSTLNWYDYSSKEQEMSLLEHQ